MSRRNHFITVVTAALAVLPHLVLAQSPVGIWFGRLAVGAINLRLVFQFTEKEDKSLSGLMISLDQGSAKIPFTKVESNATSIHAEVAALKIVFEGKLDPTGKVIDGTFTQGPSAFPLKLEKTDTIPSVKRPQEPKQPFPYRTEEVTYPNPTSKNTLGATLALPSGQGPFPAVVLITGSGAQNRHEEILGHKPFLVISDYLVRKGIAVLAVDDRGVGKSTGDFVSATTFDNATDVESSIAFLKTRTEIRKSQIGLIGHSEGGVIAPIVAARSKDVAFIVLLAGTGVKGEDLLLLQSQLVQKAAGVSDAELKEGAPVMRTLFEIARDNDPVDVAEKKLAEAEAKALKNLGKTEASKPEDRKATVAQFLSPWMRAFLAYDPRPTLKKVKCPVLVLNGSKDLQVPATQNVPEIAKALKAGKNKDVTTRVLPDLNHLFQTSKTGSPAEYGEIEETIAPVVLETIGEWILARVKA